MPDYTTRAKKAPSSTQEQSECSAFGFANLHMKENYANKACGQTNIIVTTFSPILGETVNWLGTRTPKFGIDMKRTPCTYLLSGEKALEIVTNHLGQQCDLNSQPAGSQP